jgi:8-oxo-dGTP pyrophosphatase MutT (NUDIX family)
MIAKIIKQPKFIPRKGQMDYSAARWAPVINCAVVHKDKVLMLQRSPGLKFYPGYWNGLSGFLDDHKSVEQKVYEELREELKVPKTKVKRIQLTKVFDQEAPIYKKTWIVHAVLVEISTDHVTLDWEAHTYQWVSFKEAKKLTLLPGFGEVLASVESFLKKK